MQISQSIFMTIIREGIILESHGLLNEYEINLDAVQEAIHEENLNEAFGAFMHLDEAEYRGRKVKLGKPMKGDVKKFKVFVKNPKTGNVKKVNFGDPNMEIRRDNPKARKSFRARHGCGTGRASDRTKAAFWSCKMWAKKPVSKILSGG